MHFIFPSKGSKTPASLLFFNFPLTKSRPTHLYSLALGSSLVWDSWWSALNLATNSVASYAALIAKTFGIIVKASQYSAIASYSLFPNVLAKSSNFILRAISQAPPPGTTYPDSIVLFITQRESWTDLFKIIYNKIN